MNGGWVKWHMEGYISFVDDVSKRTKLNSAKTTTKVSQNVQ